MILKKTLYPLSYVSAPTPLSTPCVLRPLSSFGNRHSLKINLPFVFSDVLLGFYKMSHFPLKVNFFPFLLLVIIPQ